MHAKMIRANITLCPIVVIASVSILQSVTCKNTCIILLKVKVTPSLVSAGEGRVAIHVQLNKTTGVPVESTQLKRERRSLRGHMQPSVWGTFSFFSLPPPPFFSPDPSAPGWLSVLPLPHSLHDCIIILSHQSLYPSLLNSLPLPNSLWTQI